MQPHDEVREPSRNVLQMVNIQYVTEIHTIYGDNLPSYEDVVIKDLPTYEEINKNLQYDRLFDES